MNLPSIYLQLQQFLDAIQQGAITLDDPALLSQQIERFISEIPRTFNELESLPRSLGVETHKQLNLLNHDLLFWRAARTAATQSQRRQKIAERLSILTTYMQQLADMSKPAGESSP
ncbi:MAG: heterocyst frequency control protein PatD [Gloeomargarita sp. DG02_4_bins_56]